MGDMKEKPQGRLVVNGWFVVAVLLFAVLLWCVEGSIGQEARRYLIIQSTLQFERTDTLPFEILGPMCWTPEQGWCDTGMDEQGYRQAYIVDFLTGRHGVMMRNSDGCWVWWFLPEFGIDGQPHIDEHYWIRCEAS